MYILLITFDLLTHWSRGRLRTSYASTGAKSRGRPQTSFLNYSKTTRNIAPKSFVSNPRQLGNSPSITQQPTTTGGWVGGCLSLVGRASLAAVVYLVKWLSAHASPFVSVVSCVVFTLDPRYSNEIITCLRGIYDSQRIPKVPSLSVDEVCIIFSYTKTIYW